LKILLSLFEIQVWLQKCSNSRIRFPMPIFSPWLKLGLGRARILRVRALYLELGVSVPMFMFSKIGLGARPAGPAQNPGPVVLGLFVYSVKTRARSSVTGPGPTQP
jgi:hypothetical protein